MVRGPLKVPGIFFLSRCSVVHSKAFSDCFPQTFFDNFFSKILIRLKGTPQDFKNVCGIYEQFEKPRRGFRGPPKGPANFLEMLSAAF